MRPPAIGLDVRAWGEDLRRWLARSWDKLTWKDSATPAVEDGTIMWDRANGYPVVAKGGAWRQIVLADGYGFLSQDNDITAAASDTAYAIVFDAPGTGEVDGISLGANPNQSRIIFAEGGIYYVSFTAQIYSTSGSDVDFYFWPRLNGVDVPKGATIASLHDNTATKPVTKSAVFSVAANDYLEAYWATSSHTQSSLKAFAATAFSPATPSVSLSITRIRA